MIYSHLNNNRVGMNYYKLQRVFENNPVGMKCYRLGCKSQPYLNQRKFSSIGTKYLFSITPRNN